MRLLLLLALAVAGCGSDPVLAGRQGPREYGGLMFYQGPDRFEGQQLHYQREPGGLTRPVEPAHFGGGTALSRDGEWLAWSDGRLRVRHLRNRTGDILTSRAYRSLEPRWSPEGRYLIYTRLLLPSQAFVTERELVIVDRITHRERILPVNARTISSPDWAPRGDLLVWQRSDPNRIELATLNGTVIRTLAAPAGDVAGVGAPRFSPDGGAVAYIADLGHEDGRDAVVVVDLDGRETSRIILAGGSFSYTWSPDGRAVAVCVSPFLSDFEYGPERVDVVDLTTGVQRTVSEAGMFACQPMWSR